MTAHEDHNQPRFPCHRKACSELLEPELADVVSGSLQCLVNKLCEIATSSYCVTASVLDHWPTSRLAGELRCYQQYLNNQPKTGCARRLDSISMSVDLFRYGHKPIDYERRPFRIPRSRPSRLPDCLCRSQESRPLLKSSARSRRSIALRSIQR